LDETDLVNDLGFDSLELAELTVIIEEEYGIDIFEHKIIRTVGEIRLILNA
jgi:acyl carrier protein